MLVIFFSEVKEYNCVNICQNNWWCPTLPIYLVYISQYCKCNINDLLHDLIMKDLPICSALISILKRALKDFTLWLTAQRCVMMNFLCNLTFTKM